MKRITYLLIPLFLLAVSCRENNGPEEEQAPEISVSPTVIEFDADGGESFDVTVKSTAAWTMTGWTDALAAWLAVDKSSGDGDETIHISTLEANPFPEDRVATLSFGIKDGPQAKLSIRQLSDASRTISLSKENVNFGSAQGESEVITVQTSKQWILEGYTDEIKQWLRVTPVEGNGETSVTLSTIAPGAETDIREAQLVFRIDRVNNATLTVTQKPAISISVSPEAISLESASGDSKTVELTPSTSLLTWKLEGYTADVKGWLGIDKTEGSGPATITFTAVSANESEQDRTAELQFTLAEGVNCTLSVTQKAKPVKETEIQLYADGPKWAVCNLGAEEPWEYGDYFAWGATEPMYKSMTWTGPADGGYTGTVTWGKTKEDLSEEEAAKYGADAAFNGYKIRNAPYFKTTSTYGKYNSTDKLTTLEEGDDAATVIRGEGWRTPTRADWNALNDNCTWTWQGAGNAEFNGVTGYKVEGKGDYAGKSIFIPSAGYFLDATFRSAITNGYYWSADLNTDALKAWRPTFSSSAVTIGGSANRCYGLPVRAVKD